MTPRPAPFLLRTLGALQLARVGGQGATEVVQRAGKPLALLAYLVANPERPVARAALADLLWGDESAESARASLRQAVHTLRKVLGDDAVTGDRSALALAPGAVDSDHRRVLAAAARGDAVEMSEWYRGPFCAAVEVRGASGWEQWRDAERERLRRQLLVVMRREVEARSVRGDLRGAAALARLLLRAEPALTEAVELGADALSADGAFDEARALLEGQRARGRVEGGDPLPGIETRLARLERAREARRAPEPRTAMEAARPQRFVAREAVLEALFRALERARSGETARLALIGPAGIGKSRVLDEFEARVRTRGVRVARVRFLPSMREIPYAALAEFARALSALPGAMGVGETSAAALVALLPELRAQFPSAPAFVADAEEVPRLRAAAIADLLAAVSEDRLTIVLRDDDQNVDAASRVVFETALARRDLRLLDVRSSRQMVEQATGLEVITLAPLTPDDVRRLLEGVGRLPDAPWVEAAVSALLSGSAGIPQLLLQRLRAFGDAGALRIDGDAWVAPDPAGLQRGLSPVTELAQLVGALRPDARLALDLLALWRRPMREADASAVLAMLRRAPGGGEWRGALAHLEERGLVVVRDEGWTVAHDTVADACLAALPPTEAEPMLRACTRHWAATGALTVPILEHLASLCGLWSQQAAAAGLVRAASRDRALRAVGVQGEALARRVALAAGRPEWSGELERSIGWMRRQSRGALLGYGSVAGVAAAALVWLVLLLQPRIVVESPPIGEGIAIEGEPVEGAAVLVVQPRVAVYNGFGRLLKGYTGSVRVSSPDRELAGDSVIPFVEGRAQFEGLGIRRLRPGVPADGSPAILRFSSGLARPGETTVPGAWSMQAVDGFRVVRVSVNGRPLDAARRARASLGDSLRIDLTFEYTTLHPTANYVVAAAPNWGDHRSGTIRLAGLPRPVREAWQTVHFAVPSPALPGVRHVIVLMLAEDSAEHVMSLTSWTLGLPRWDDGRDAQDFTRDQLDSLRLTGRARAWRDAQSYQGRQSSVIVGDLKIDRTQINSFGVELLPYLGTAIEVEFYDASPVR